MSTCYDRWRTERWSGVCGLALGFVLSCAVAGLAADADSDGVDDAQDVCPNTPAGVAVDPTGRPLGDLDRDCDADLFDYAVLQLSFTGPLPCVPVAERCDDGIDNDCDGRVDCDDVDCVGECGRVPPYVNIQVDAEGESLTGVQQISDALRNRGILATVFATGEFGNRYSYFISDLYYRGFEIAMHGQQAGEELASMTYAEQKSRLTQAMNTLQGCAPCGTAKPISGFRPQLFSQNADTFTVLDELEEIEYNAGFKAGQVAIPGHESATLPFAVDGHNWAAVPLTMINFQDQRIHLEDVVCAQEHQLTGAQWGDLLQQALQQAYETETPLLFIVHGSYTGDNVNHDYWQPFLDFLDGATGKATFVKTQELVDAYINP